MGRKLNPGDPEDGDLKQRNDDRALRRDPRLDSPERAAMQAYLGERDEHPGRFLITGTRRGYRARAGQCIDQPRCDRTLGPLIIDSDIGYVPDESTQQDGERGKPSGEGHREPGIDQGESDDAAGRRDDGGHGQDTAGWSAARIRCAANHPANQVSGGKPLGQPEATGEDVTGQPVPELFRGGGSAHSAGQLAKRPAAHYDDDQRGASGQPVGRAARRARGRARRNRHVQGVPRDRRKQRARDGPGHRGDGEQDAPVRTSPSHPQQQPVGGAAQRPLGGIATVSPAVRHGCPPARGTARECGLHAGHTPRRARDSWARVLQAERDAGRAVAQQEAEAAVGAPAAAPVAVPAALALQFHALHVEERHVGVTSL